MSSEIDAAQASGAASPRPRASRRAWWISCIAVVAAALAAITAGYAASSSTGDTRQRETQEASTVRVTAGNMVSQTQVSGSLRYSDMQPVTSRSVGVVTELPSPGATIDRGGVLFRVNTLPVILLTGTTPAWRDFSAGMDDGADVKQLEENLAAMGFFSDAPDERFTEYTTAAITRWQDEIGVEPTGRIERSLIVFSPHDLRVDTLGSRVGAEVAPGTALYQATSARIVAELELRSTDRGLAVLDATAKVSLPTGEEIDGVVETVGSPVSKVNDDGRNAVVVPVRLSLQDQDAVKNLALAGVTVGFASTLREDVLTVPVDALVPIDDSRFAVELPTPSRDGERTVVPVAVGAFASGLVEISGKGIEEGVEVVVPG